MKVEDILEVLTFNNHVCIFEYSDGDECEEFFNGPKELVPVALHDCKVKYIYLFDNVLQICIL